MMLRIFLVSDRRIRPDQPIVELLAEAAAAGVDRIQLREKDLQDRDLYHLACATVEACRPHGCRIYINRRLDIALACGADGLHLPADGVLVDQARAAAGNRLEIGVSTHSLEEARSAETARADYIFFGPIFSTPGKREFGSPLGVELLAEAAKELKVPMYAIGGIDRDTAPLLSGLPIAGVALIRGILSEPDVPAAVGVLRERLSMAKFGLPEEEIEEEEEVEEETDEDEDGGETPGGEGGWGIG